MPHDLATEVALLNLQIKNLTEKLEDMEAAFKARSEALEFEMKQMKASQEGMRRTLDIGRIGFIIIAAIGTSLGWIVAAWDKVKGMVR